MPGPEGNRRVSASAAEIPSPSSIFLLSSFFVSYRPAILLCALVPLLLWQRSTTPAEVPEPAASPMAPTKRPRSTSSKPLAGFGDAAARGNHDSLRSWAAGLSDPELRENLEATVDRITQDTTASKEELFHLRPLLCALAMEGGRRDISGFTQYLWSMGPENGQNSLFSDAVFPAIAGHAENNPADAWARLQGASMLGSRSFVAGELYPEGTEIADYIFRLWASQDPAAAISGIEEFVSTGQDLTAWKSHAISAIARVRGPEEVSRLVHHLDFPTLHKISAVLAMRDPQAVDPAYAPEFLPLWTHEDPDAALAYATSLGTQEALLAVAKGFLRDDPRRAMDLLYSLNDPEAATALLKSWQPGDANDGAWPVFPGAAPRVNANTRKDAIFFALHRLQPPE